MLPEPARCDAIHIPIRYDAQAPPSATASTPNDASAGVSPSPSASRISDETSWATTHAPMKVTIAVDDVDGPWRRRREESAGEPEFGASAIGAEPATSDDATGGRHGGTRAVR